MTRPLHPLGWFAWLLGVCVYALQLGSNELFAAASNPWHSGVALATVLLVHLASPPDASPVGRAVRTFLVAGAVLLVLRLAFTGLLPNPGRTVLLTLPQLRVAGLRLGGPLTAEVLAEAGAEGLRLMVVLAAFGVFNARVDLSALLRSVPPVLREVGLVVGIAASFVPGLLATARDVRDAQRMRGQRGLRTLAPSLAVPILGRTLERSFMLAESMDARGYGAASGPAPTPLPAAAGAAAMVAGVAVWTAGAPRAATLLVGAGLAGVVVYLRAVSRASLVTRMASRRPGLVDACVALMAAGAALSARLPEASWTAYPVLQPPELWVPAVLPVLGFAAPAVVEVLRR
ncbi:MAG TPA: energy-coupling factor transporter transmembrane component T [Actinomycetota bacterium]|nr:energy-coupling factor transporter transmembrane component T [Actinomycetota bacterium]